MSIQPLFADPIDQEGVPTHVNAILGEFLSNAAETAVAGRMPAEVVEVLRDFLFAGGKRLRPMLCVVGWHAADGSGDIAPVLRVAASLEMFHASCLIHDDIMDNSATRRGKPTVHRALAARHAAGRPFEAAHHLGASVAILVGNLALTWADELLYTAGLTSRQLTAVLPLITAMRAEVMYGQYLDLTATGRPTTDIARALTTIRYKTAKYTVERPLHIGAALAGADRGLREALSEFALPLGEAFQLRDDLLGVFGEPATTGKPRLDDLREGKSTTLIALALARATPTQAAQLRRYLGNDGLTEEQAATVRAVITGTGARQAVERMINRRYERALARLRATTLAPAAAGVLRHLAESAVRRTT